MPIFPRVSFVLKPGQFDKLWQFCMDNDIDPPTLARGWAGMPAQKNSTPPVAQTPPPANPKQKRPFVARRPRKSIQEIKILVRDKLLAGMPNGIRKSDLYKLSKDKGVAVKTLRTTLDVFVANGIAELNDKGLYVLTAAAKHFVNTNTDTDV